MTKRVIKIVMVAAIAWYGVRLILFQKVNDELMFLNNIV